MYSINQVYKKLSKVMYILVIMVVVSIPVFARSSSEIANDIKKQQDELKKTQSDLKNAENNLNYYNSLLANSQSGIPQLETEIKKLEVEIEKNKLELDVIKQNKQLKELEREQKEIDQNSTLKTIYMDWRIESTLDVKEALHSYDFKKYEKYASVITSSQKKNIYQISNELNDINKEIDDYEIKLKDLDKKIADLEEQKRKLEEQIALSNSMIVYSNGQISNLQVSTRSIQSSITSLSEEQRQAILREEEILRQNQGTLGNTNCSGDSGAPAGSVYFCGNGRDLIMGHGVGMSQYGAKGAADQGWNATQILQFYYTGSQVTQYSLNSEISVKYCQSNPALDPYQDGCSNGQAPVVERVSFDTYLSGLGEMPASWAMEARKAQMIAARTYAARYTNNGDPNYPICLTTYCQVSYFKNGNTGEASVVNDTKDLVITYGGQLIEALYSADNNQGNGSSDYDTRFQDLAGNGSGVKPYLKAVNDNQFAQNARLYSWTYCQADPCGLWKWKSRSYSFSDFDTLLSYSGLGGWVNEIGGVSSISFERDPSLRVKKVYLNGNNGSIKVMGGWWFKYYWNIWVDSKGTYDFIYSQTYYLNAN